MSKEGQCGTRTLAAEHFVMRSRGDVFRLSEFAHALQLPMASAYRYLALLLEQDVVRQDEDTLEYRMSLSFRNMLIATGKSLVPYRKEASV